MYQAVIFSVAVALAVLPCYLLRGKPEARAVVLKILAFGFGVITLFRFFLSDSFLYVINGAWFEGVWREETDYLHSILRWGYYTNCAVLPMATFTDSRLFRNIAVGFSFPFSILTTVYFHDHMAYFLADSPHGFQTASWFRYSFFMLELIVALAVPLMILISEWRSFRPLNRRDWINYFICLPAVVAVMIPTYVPQSFLGYNVRPTEKFSSFHLLWLAALLLVTLALYYLFRFRPQRERYLLCLFLTIVLFFHYDSLYMMGITTKRLPVQLCNIAAYFYMICIPFKMKRMFHFCFIVNLVGTLIALVMPDLTTSGFSFWNVHFILEHSLVLMIPALAMGLRVFPRLKRSSLGYAAIGFVVYFLFVFALGTFLNGQVAPVGQDPNYFYIFDKKILFEPVNYFYMFDQEYAFKQFSFLTFAGKYRIAFGKYEVYPVLISIVFVAFSLLCYLFYRLVKIFYRLEDDHLELRLSSIDLQEKITGKPSRRPKSFID